MLPSRDYNPGFGEFSGVHSKAAWLWIPQWAGLMVTSVCTVFLGRNGGEILM